MGNRAHLNPRCGWNRLKRMATDQRMNHLWLQSTFFSTICISAIRGGIRLSMPNRDPFRGVGGPQYHPCKMNTTPYQHPRTCPGLAVEECPFIPRVWLSITLGAAALADFAPEPAVTGIIRRHGGLVLTQDCFLLLRCINREEQRSLWHGLMFDHVQHVRT